MVSKGFREAEHTSIATSLSVKRGLLLKGADLITPPGAAYSVLDVRKRVERLYCTPPLVLDVTYFGRQGVPIRSQQVPPYSGDLPVILPGGLRHWVARRYPKSFGEIRTH